jgi:Elongation factor P (EF-P) KOW-like domain
MKQARGAAKTTIKFKNLIRGTTIENTYRSGEKFETALIEKMDAQFTFQEGVRILFSGLFFIIQYHTCHTLYFDQPLRFLRFKHTVLM